MCFQVVKWMDAALQKRRREEHLLALRAGQSPTFAMSESMLHWYFSTFFSVLVTDTSPARQQTTIFTCGEQPAQVLIQVIQHHDTCLGLSEVMHTPLP